MWMTASTGPVTFICPYAPTLTSTDNEKDCFYEALDATIKCVPNKEGLYILGSSMHGWGPITKPGQPH